MADAAETTAEKTAEKTGAIRDLTANAGQAAEMLKLLAHDGRLLILCHLTVEGELSVGDIAERVGLSQSALSQHLAKMWEAGLVVRRRQSQTVFYRVGDARVARILAVLKDIYCP